MPADLSAVVAFTCPHMTLPVTDAQRLTVWPRCGTCATPMNPVEES